MVVVGVVDSKLQGDSWPMSAHFALSPFAHTLQRTYRCVPVSEVPGRQHLRSARCHQLSVLRVHPQQFWDSCIFCWWTNSLEFTA